MPLEPTRSRGVFFVICESLLPESSAERAAVRLEGRRTGAFKAIGPRRVLSNGPAGGAWRPVAVLTIYGEGGPRHFVARKPAWPGRFWTFDQAKCIITTGRTP